MPLPDGSVGWTSTVVLDEEATEEVRIRRANQWHAVRVLRLRAEGGGAEIVFGVPGRSLPWLLYESLGPTDEVLSVRALGLGPYHDSRLWRARLHHEAGHALALAAAGNLWFVEGATTPAGRPGGQAQPLRGWCRGGDLEFACHHLVVAHAGPVAHRRFLLCQAVPDDEDLGLTVWYAGERDRSQRARILGDLGLDWEAECALRDAAEAEAVRLVSQQWEAIVNVASALAQQGRLEQADVRRIIEAG